MGANAGGGGRGGRQFGGGGAIFPMAPQGILGGPIGGIGTLKGIGGGGIAYKKKISQYFETT